MNSAKIDSKFIKSSLSRTLSQLNPSIGEIRYEGAKQGVSYPCVFIDEIVQDRTVRTPTTTFLNYSMLLTCMVDPNADEVNTPVQNMAMRIMDSLRKIKVPIEEDENGNVVKEGIILGYKIRKEDEFNISRIFVQYHVSTYMADEIEENAELMMTLKKNYTLK